MDEVEAVRLFNIWYKKPLELLKRDVEVGANAGWIALMVTFPLYERMLTVKLTTAKQTGKQQTILKLMRDDLNFTLAEAETFWHIMRDGLLHQAMPNLSGQNGQHGYAVHMAEGLGLPYFGPYDGKPAIHLDPWAFADHVIELYDTPEWILNLRSHPWAWIEFADEIALEVDDKGQPQDFGLSTDFEIPSSPPKIIYGPGTLTTY